MKEEKRIFLKLIVICLIFISSETLRVRRILKARLLTVWKLGREQRWKTASSVDQHPLLKIARSATHALVPSRLRSRDCNQELINRALGNPKGPPCPRSGAFGR